MSNLSRVVLLATVAITAAVAHTKAQPTPSLHTGYWQQSNYSPPPQNDFDECLQVTTQTEMETVLRGAGWDFDDGIPDVRWETDTATIIMPDEHPANFEFYWLARRGSEIELSWGWSRPPNPEPTTHPDGTVSISLGARAAMFEIAVVSYARRDVEGLDINCRVR